MPGKIKSKAQQRYMFATHSEMAREMAGHQDLKRLPERVKPKKATAKAKKKPMTR